MLPAGGCLVEPPSKDGAEFSVAYEGHEVSLQFDRAESVRSNHGCGKPHDDRPTGFIRDLWSDRLADHDIIAAIAGDSTAGRTFLIGDGNAEQGIDARDLDRLPPEQDFLVLDADSSQMRAIAAVARGQSGILIGPPGTGKSQTIANLICQLIANGKRVLFVAEKRAALDVVKDRLAHQALDGLVLDLHGSPSRKRIAAQLAEALSTVSGILPPPVEELHREFLLRRARLNHYTERLHAPREPSRYSTYELIGQLMALQASGANSAIRWYGIELARLTRDQVASIGEVLQRAAGESGLLVRDSTSPWTNAELQDQDSAITATGIVEELVHRQMPELEDQIRRCTAALQLKNPRTLSDYDPLLAVIGEANTLLALYLDTALQLDLSALAIALAPARQPLSALWALISSSAYRAARQQLLRQRSSNARSRRLLREAERLLLLTRCWSDLARAGSHPQSYANQAQLGSAHTAALHALRQLRRYVGLPPDTTPISQLEEHLRWMADDRLIAARIPHVRGFEREIEALGGAGYLRELTERRTLPDHWRNNLLFAWLSSCLEDTLRQEPELAVFDGRQHNRLVQEFRDLDKRRLILAVDRVKRAFAEHAIEMLNRFPDQTLQLKHQAALRSRHIPFRALVRTAPNVVTSLKPCWMASPLAVSQLLGGQQQYFDVVIFDEASQVRPVDAVTSLLRARSVVVAGDPDQLPPTPFFAAEREREEERVLDEEGPGDFESIIHAMKAFLPEWRLDWHYRSHDDRLISFSNHHVYSDRLVTFPGAGGSEPPLSHIHAAQVRLADTEERSSSAEVDQVVKLIVDHATARPAMSLGVIAMGLPHAKRIDLDLARARRDHPELDAFFNGHPNEPFFVKNLERVQGDERDYIILTVGYGKDASGRLLYRFGPLLGEHGHRRLNVAVTRAKRGMIVVSSFSHEDMDPSRSTSRGAELLRQYLEYARSGGRIFSDSKSKTTEVNAFEAQVQTALEREGLSVIPQFGASSYRIDLAVQHPQRPGRFVLAVECDGAPYHSSPMARDRDRLRQEHLEQRGWRFVRVWSTAWYKDPTAEIARVVDAYRRELARDDSQEQPRAIQAQEKVVISRAAARGPWPGVPRRQSITQYSLRELDDVARWIRSDGLLRTDDDMLMEMIRALGFQHRGSRIEAACRTAIRRTRPPA